MAGVSIQKKEGVCIRCGKCCKPPVMVSNPCIEKGQKQCKFYTATDNLKQFGHCLIIGRTGDIEKVKDASDNLITKEQIDWFNENCPSYPVGQEMIDGHEPPIGCGFYLAEVVI